MEGGPTPQLLVLACARRHLMHYLRLLFASALALTLAGCGQKAAVQPVATHPPHKVHVIAKPLLAPPWPTVQSGINVEVWNTPTPSQIDGVINAVAALHVRTVAIVIPFGQSNWQANNVGPVHFTPSPRVIRQVILQAYHDHLSVMLRPMLDEGTLTPSGHWRGDIAPQSLNSWFKHYAQALIPYAALGQQEHVGAFDIGTELSSIESDNQGWDTVIHAVKQAYQGPLLYSFNWNSPSLAALPPWTKQLTWIGLDAYYPLNTPSGTESALVQAWQPWISQTAKIPNLVITELGVMPKPRAWQAPWVWDPPGPTNWSVQAQYDAAAIKAWQGHAQGLYWWGVMLPRSGQGASFDPIGHPSAAVIQTAW